MNLDKDARKIKSILKKSFGEHGKAIPHNRHDGFHYTRDGMKIVEAVTAGSDSPLSYETYRTAKRIAEQAGDGTTSGSIAFLNGFLFSEGERINEDALNIAVYEALRKLKSKTLGITKERVSEFVNTCCGKSINTDGVKKLASTIYDEVYTRNRYCSLSDELDYSIDEDDQQISIKTENGFAFEFHAPHKVISALRDQSKSNWLVTFNDTEFALNDFIETDKMMMESLDTDRVPANSKLLIVTSSIAYALSAHLQERDMSRSKTFVVYMPCITTEHASDLIEAMRNSIGSNIYITDMLTKLRLTNAHGKGHDVREALIKHYGENKEFDDISGDEELFALHHKSTEELALLTDEARREQKELKAKKFSERAYNLEQLLNRLGISGVGITSVESLETKNKTIFLSGFKNASKERSKELRIKNSERAIKDHFTDELRRKIDIIYSDSGTAVLHILASVPFSRRQDIRDSIIDVMDSFYLLKTQGHGFVNGDFRSIQELIPSMWVASNEERVLTMALKKTHESYLESKHENYLGHESEEGSNALDSSLSIEHVIKAARDGIMYRRNNVTDTIIIEGVNNVN